MAPRRKSARGQRVAKAEKVKQTKAKVTKTSKKSFKSSPTKASTSPSEGANRRKSTRKRPTRRNNAGDPVFDDKDIEYALRIINESSDGEKPDFGAALKTVLGISNGEKRETQEEQPNAGKEGGNRESPSKRKKMDTSSISDNDIDIDIYDDDEDKDFEVSKRQIPPPSKKGRKRVPSRQAVVSVRKPAPPPEDDDREQRDNNERFAAHIRAPRSLENSKYKEVYESIPKLRSVSPPRFTTKGVCKKKLNCQELGVKIVGKTIGNPFSSHSKKRNGIIYGNQPLNTIEEMEKFTGVALKIKEVLNKQARAVRLSSYVRPDVLSTKRKELVKSKPRSSTKMEEDVDIDVDIETVDDVEDYATLEPEDRTKPVQKRHHRGRKPGRSILECEDCGYKTTHSGHMKVHIVCVHKDVKLLECQYAGCGYRCSRKGSMTRHEKCVHRKDKVFKCEQCPFKSAWSISLERHIITKHEKLKPWTCQLCKRSFGQQFTLTQHLNTVHKKMKRIRCAFCAFRSSTKVSVRSHILRMHKAEIAKAVGEVEEKGRNGQASEELDEHMMIATFSPLSEADVIGIPIDSITEGTWSVPSTSTKESEVIATSSGNTD